MILILSDNDYIRDQIAAYLDHKDLPFQLASSPGSERGDEVNVKSDPASLAGTYDIIISAHCKQIFPAALVSGTTCVNLHPGYNPDTRGWHAQTFAILDGKKLGFTVHLMDEKVDHGAIIYREEVDVRFDDTSASAYQRLVKAEVASFDRWLPALVTGDFETSAPEGEGNYHSLKDVTDLFEIDLDAKGTFREFYDRLRALSFPPHQNAFVRDPESGEKIFLTLAIERSKQSD